jgi:FkbM family methyltransferase
MPALNLGEVLRCAARKVIPRPIYTIGVGTLNGVSCLVKVGYKNTLLLRNAERGTCGAQEVRFELPQLRHPFYVRTGTTDASGIVQNIVREEWGAFLPREPVRFIVDAGANCGDTTAWYLSKFPQATVVALEPDPENYAMLRKNCQPYGSRAVLLNAALWSSDARLTVRSAMTPVAVSVDEADGDAQGGCEGISMPQLLRRINTHTIDILKVDIEGAELQLFSNHPEEWLPHIRCLTVETHGAKELEAVYTAVRPYGYINKTYRNTHIFMRRK